MAAGCGADGAASLEVGSQTAALLAGNGRTQNGRTQNGRTQNGRTQNGAELALAGVDLTTMRRLLVLPAAGQDPDLSPANLVPVPNVRLVKTMLTDGAKSGVAFAGHVVDGTLADDAGHAYPVRVYIESVSPTADPEIFHYVLKTYHQFIPAPGDSCDGTCPMQWDYACGTVARPPEKKATLTAQAFGGIGGVGLPVVYDPVPATAVGGQWDYAQGHVGDGRKVIEQGDPRYDTHITFACTTGAIGKCVEKLHYKPWALAARECKVQCTGKWFPPRCVMTDCVQPTQELLHEACVRMIRADYCGDGVSHTHDGIQIDVWDQSSINTETPYSKDLSQGVPFGHEAEWTPNGARCLPTVMMARLSSDVDNRPLLEYLNANCYQKWKDDVGQNGYFEWSANDCFGKGPVSLHYNTYYYANVPAGYDWHNRVLIEQKSQCIDDQAARFNDDPNTDMSNPMKTFPPCMQDIQ